MQTALSSIWIRVVVFISNKSNRYGYRHEQIDTVIQVQFLEEAVWISDGVGVLAKKKKKNPNVIPSFFSSVKVKFRTHWCVSFDKATVLGEGKSMD